MASLPKRRIAASYLPDRHHYWYSLSKLTIDPLYDAVHSVFAGNSTPLLDIGCGIGLLPLCLRANGGGRPHTGPYVGIDSDAAKIDVARDACRRAGIADVSFEVVDLATSFPEHRGSVALLDVLQYLEPETRDRVIAGCARCLTKDSMLVIRGGLADGSWRAAVTRAADRAGHALRWMRTPFRSQPTAASLAASLAAHGLTAEFHPLAGHTPFNNWLVLARRHAAE
jgi:SAM-dependent methyltransferase